MWILTTLNILFTQNNRFMGSSKQLTKRMVVFVWIACTELKNEFANSENVLYKRCFVTLEKVNILKLVKSNSLTTVEKIQLTKKFNYFFSNQLKLKFNFKKQLVPITVYNNDNDDATMTVSE